MGLRQFANSLGQIARNSHVHRPRALARHLAWQVRKQLRQFPFEQALAGSRIIATDGTCGVSALIYSQGLYDYNNMNLLRWLLRDGGVFIDVGANIGSYTVIASESPSARVLAFEPHPATFEKLVANITLNQRDNVVSISAALSDHVGEVLMTDLSASAVNHLILDPAPGALRVPCRRADTILGERNLVPTYVKVDVEGAELDVLRGFGDRISDIQVLFVETNHLGDRHAVHRYLTTHGLDGPFSCDFDRRRLERWQATSTEDSIYVASSFRFSAW